MRKIHERLHAFLSWFLPSLVLGLLVQPTPVAALQLEVQVSINLVKLNTEFRNRLNNLERELTNYLNDYRAWGSGDYDLIIPLTVQVDFKTASPRGTTYHYTAAFTCSDGAEHQYIDGQWQFDLAEYAQLQHDGNYDSFTGLVDFYVNILIGHQIDKLVEFGGDPWFEEALRIQKEAKFDRNTQGWDRRDQLIQKLLSEDQELLRTLSWVYHQTLYFYEVLENDYEAWNAAVLCVDILEDLDGVDQERARFLNFSYVKLGNILLAGKNPAPLNRLLRIDRAHEDYYQRLLDEL